MQDNDLLSLTAEIVSAHVENNSVSVADLPALIANVHGALSGLGEDVKTPEVAQEPAVSVRASVKPEAITCLECGLKQKTIKRHLNNAHGLSPDQYRMKWKLSADYPMVARLYSEQRRALAKSFGLGRQRHKSAKE